MLLIRGFLVAVTGREHHAFHSEFHHFVKEEADAVGFGPFKEGGVGGDAEATFHGFFDGFDSGVVGAVTADSGIVFRLQTVHVHAEG